MSLPVVIVCAFVLSIYFSFPPAAEPPCDGSVSASSSRCPLMSPCAHLLPRHHAHDVLISPAHGCRGSPRCALSLLYRCTPICQRVAFSGRVGLPQGVTSSNRKHTCAQERARARTACLRLPWHLCCRLLILHAVNV